MKFILLITLFFLPLLHADIIEEYIEQVVAIEKVAEFDENSTVSADKDVEEKRTEFFAFFIEFLADIDDEKVENRNIYRSELFKLKRRIKTNRSLENSYAVLRDEAKSASLELKQNMRNTLFKVVKIASDSHYKAFDKKLQDIIIERHTSEPDVDLSKYRFVKDLETFDTMTRSISDNIKEYIALQDIHNALSALLIEESHPIYKAVLLSGYGILPLALKIEESSLGIMLTPYLKLLHLNTSKLFYIVLIVIMTLLFRYFIMALFRKIFLWYTESQDDTQYILSKTAKPFRLLLLFFALELIYMVYSGFSDVQWVINSFNIMYVLLVVLLIYRIGNAIAVVKMEKMNLNNHVRNEVVNLALKMMNIFLIIIALIFILKILGVNLTALLSGLGIGGVAVAFAAKDTLSNFFGSLSILMSDMFEQGDWIAVDGLEGHVVEIGLRATTIRTFDNALIALPNFRLADNGIKNWSRRKMGRRIKMTIGVTYESDMENIKKALVDIREMLHDHPLLMGAKTEFSNSERQMKLVSREDLKGIKRSVMVYLDTFNSSSIDILVYCFSRSVVWNEWHEAKEDVMFKIADILKANDLSFAYPTMMLHQAQEESDEQERTLTE